MRAARGVHLPSSPVWEVFMWVSQADVFLKLQERGHITAGTHSWLITDASVIP